MGPLSILIMGLSGSGKSTSIRTLNPNETFLINCNSSKLLPFRGVNKMYTEVDKTNNPKGNMITTDDYKMIGLYLKGISEKRQEIANIVIDDSQSLIINEFMRRHSTEGKGKEIYQLYNDIADHFFNLIDNLQYLRSNLTVFFLHHAEYNDNGHLQCKSTGRLLNEKIEIPSLFTIVLLSIREGEQNFFLTQNDGTNPAKSPDGMFNSLKIDNDLQIVKDAAINYFEGE